MGKWTKPYGQVDKPYGQVDKPLIPLIADGSGGWSS